MAGDPDYPDTVGQHTVFHGGGLPALRVAHWSLLARAGIYLVLRRGRRKCLGPTHRSSSTASHRVSRKPVGRRLLRDHGSSNPVCGPRRFRVAETTPPEEE